MTVIVMGMTFDSESVPDFGSIRMTVQRHNNVNDYILNSEDVSKLYNVSNAADGSTAICIDNKDIYVLHMSEWKKFGGDSDDKSTLDGLITRDLLEIRNTRVNRIGSSAFQNCGNLITADFPSVASIGSSAFQNCGNLITADFPSIASIGSSAFQNCGNLITADFPSVASIGSSAFQNCGNLITADFPSIASIGSSAFQNCGNLITADFPSVASIGSSAFQQCSRLKKIVLKGTEMVTLVSASAFFDAPIAWGTGYIYVPDNQVDNYKIATNWVTYANQIKGISELEEAE